MTELRASDTVAAKIRSLRELLGWSRRELAERCGLSENVIENIESGRPDAGGDRRRDVTVDELMAIARGLDISPVRLMPDEAGLPDSVDAELAESRRRQREADIREQQMLADQHKRRLGELEHHRVTIENEIRDVRNRLEVCRQMIVMFQAEGRNPG